MVEGGDVPIAIPKGIVGSNPYPLRQATIVAPTASFETCTDWDELSALAAEWDALWQRARTGYLIESFDWARLTWIHPHDAGRLFCLSGRQGGRLALIWPFLLRGGRPWSIAEPLATVWGDYSTVLTDDSGLIEAAWRRLRATCPADLIHLPFMRAGSRLAAVVAATGAAVHLHTLPAPWVSWQGIGTWDAYLHGLSPDQRRDLGRKHRRLAETGSMRFEIVTASDAARPVIDWMLHHKAVWLEHSEKSDTTWIRDDRFRAFLYDLMVAFGPSQRCAIFVLRIGDRIVAADLASIDDVRVGWYMGTFDAGFRRYSPGHVLKEYALHWAFDRGLDFDMRLGDGEHKRFWANRTEPTVTWRAAASAWGRAYVLAKRAQALRAALRR